MTLTEKADVTGQTETSILTATLRLHGIEDDEPYLTRYRDALAAEYDRHREDLVRRGRSLPGARRILESLAAAPHVVQGVLTGNLREVARIKLEVFDLDKYIDLNSSAYGDDDSYRPNLVAVAQGRAAGTYDTVFDRESTFVIGDSTHDVNTGLRGGARAIGVATGGESEDRLRAAGAHTVWRDLTDIDAMTELFGD